jgi:Flavodoxin
MDFTVVYESIYGNTGTVAEEIAAGLGDHGTVTLVAADQAVGPFEFLVAGAPTHAHGLPTKMSRAGVEDAVDKRLAAGEDVVYHPTAGMRAFIDGLTESDGAPAACFDTRFEKSAILTGSAAKVMAKKLKKLGYTIVAEPESFFVLDSEGPLKDGELDRARKWGSSIGSSITLRA